jgi:VanZ family protein
MFFKSILPAILWALFILIICGIPGQKLPHLDFLDWLKPDKIVHLFVFGLLSYLLMKGFLRREMRGIFRKQPALFAFLLSAVYGCVIEVLQEYVFINRSGEVFDALADAAGALLGIWLYRYLVKKRSSTQPASR